MNYLRLAIAILFLAFAQCSHADTIQTFYATQVSILMDSTGAVGWSITGPGLEITGDGGALCLGCYPGGGGGPSGRIFIGFYSSTVIFGGKTYGDELFFSTTPFDDNLGLNPTATGTVGDQNVNFKLILPQNGQWNFDFVPDPDNPDLLLFNGGTFSASATVTPEPATVSLVLTGLVAIAGIIKKKSREAKTSLQAKRSPLP